MIPARLGENFPTWLTIPRNLLSSEMFLGGCICLIADILSGSGRTPLSSRMWPRNLNDCFPNSHFCGLRATSFSFNLSNTAVRRRSCSSHISTRRRSGIRIRPFLWRSETCAFGIALGHWLFQAVVCWNNISPSVLEMSARDSNLLTTESAKIPNWHLIYWKSLLHSIGLAGHPPLVVGTLLEERSCSEVWGLRRFERSHS